MDWTTLKERPTVRLLKTVGLAIVAIPLAACAVIASGKILRYPEYAKDVAVSARENTSLGEASAVPLSGTLVVESEAGRATIYVDKMTGARVLCATGSSCVLLPAPRQSSR